MNKNYIVNKKYYGTKFNDHLLEQYKSYAEMATTASKRRDQANRFYIILLSGLFALLSILIQIGVMGDNQYLLLLAFAILGLGICYLWFKSITSYGILSKAKYDTLREMEKSLPYRCYSEEWDRLKDSNYEILTKVESRIPIIFGIFYSVLLLYSLINLLTQLGLVK